MKRLTLAVTLLSISGTALAQAPKPSPCTTIQAENAALKEKVAAYEARLGIGGTTSVINGDNELVFKFVSCKASKASHKAILTLIVTNSGQPTKLTLSGAGSSNFGNDATLVVDEEGRAYRSEDFWTYVGGNIDANVIPSNVPVNCTIPLANVPTSVSRLNSATVAFYKRNAKGENILMKTTIQNIPVTWTP